MGKVILALALALGLYSALPASPADADSRVVPQLEIVGDFSFDTADSFVRGWSFWGWLRERIQEFKGGDEPGGIEPPASGADVPELDMTVAGGAIVLLLGGVAFIASRRREREAQQ